MPNVQRAIKTFSTRKDVQELEKAMQASKNDLIIRFDKALRNEQSKLNRLMSSLSERSNDFQRKNETSLRRMREDILEQIKAGPQMCNTLKDLRVSCSLLKENSSAIEMQQAFLNALYYQEMHRRYHNILEAHTGSFSWIFDKSHEDIPLLFTEWLESRSGTYWITGKPGCGKSTLVKYAFDHPRTLEGLCT